MNGLYTLSVKSYAFLLSLVASFIPKAKDWVQGRKEIWKNLPNVNNREVYWFHCASLGEFDQGLPVMNLLRESKPDAFILVTFFSPSGMNHYHKRNHPADHVCYIPVDTKKNAKRFVAHFQPKMAVFVKYEFWVNHLEVLRNSGSKLFSVSTALRPNQHFFKWYGGFFRKALTLFDHFFAQNQSTVNLLQSIGIYNVSLTGDTRFDRVIENKNNLHVNAQIQQFADGADKIFIAGSTWPKDEELLTNLIQSSLFDKYIIAPHNVDETHVLEIIERLNVSVIRLSQFEKYTNEKVLVIDSIGQLASAYSVAHLAYVGGGFSGSLHNILEPAVFGLPVLYGPKFSRFPEGDAFIDAGIGFTVSNSHELIKKVEEIDLENPLTQARSIAFVENNKGAAQKVIDYILR